MSRAGAPIRFLVVVLGGWIAVRVALLWPGGTGDAIAPAPLRSIVHEIAGTIAAAPAAADLPHPVPRRQTGPVAAAPARGVGAAPTGSPPPVPSLRSHARDDAATPGGAAIAGVDGQGRPRPIPLALTGMPEAERSATTAAIGPGPRLSGSAWSIVRGAGARGLASTPQLGGSQAGLRLAYALGRSRRLAATLRVASALGSPDREFAPGLEWRVPHAPLRVFVEQRVALGRNRGGTAAGAIAGVSRTLPAHFALEGYAQGGVVARDGAEGFADGAVRVDRVVARAGGMDVALGAGAWSAAQRGAARIDIGPTLGARVPVAHGAIRVAVEWRARVAGGARPATGPALSLGADF